MTPSRSDGLTGTSATLRRRITSYRGRFTAVDHLVRAHALYVRRQGELLAAGVTYYAFLALFPFLLLVASLVGLVLSGREHLQARLIEAIQDAIPGPTGDQVVAQLTRAIEVSGVTGVVALVSALYVGLRAVGKLRIGMTQIWKGRVDPPRFLRDALADLTALGILAGLGLAGLVLTGAVSQETARVQEWLRLAGIPANGTIVWVLGTAVAVAGDVVVFLWLLRVVPGVHHPLRLLLPGALFGAAGLEILKLLGGVYLRLISGSLTAAAVGGAFGILVWINIVTRFAFLTAAWTATLPALRGRTSPAGHPEPEEPPISPPDSSARDDAAGRLRAGG